MSAQRQDGEAGVASLLADVAAGLGRLVKGELLLDRTEAAEGLKAAGSGLVKIGVAAIPLSAFYGNGFDQGVVRFCFAKKDETLHAAIDRLARL